MNFPTSLVEMLRSDAGTATAEYSLVMATFAISTIGIFQTFISVSGSNLTTTQSGLEATALSLPTPTPSST